MLIHPPPHGEVPFRHIGLAYLQAMLKKAGIETIFYDISAAENNAGTDFYDDYILHLSKNVGNVGDGIDPRILMEVIHPDMFDAISPVSAKIIAKAEKYLKILLDSGDVFLFSVNIITYYFAAALAYRLRRHGKKTAAGGPNMRFAPLRRLFLKSGAFDAVVQGEGEGVVVELVNQLALGKNPQIPGVSILNGDGVISDTPPADPLPLDQIPAPSFSGMEVKDFAPVLAGRGCTFRCSFCSEPYNWSGYRVREPVKMIDEMEWSAAQYRTKNFHFHDDLINGDLKWFDAFLAGLIDRGLRFGWESFCSPNGLTPERLDRMKESGCILLKLGVQ
ncbi:MAG: radical SAM protein, partial [Deltaproteobacteria bacterium]|nr:radical SAM protein [Deltaproteobacteria bacterium]